MIRTVGHRASCRARRRRAAAGGGYWFGAQRAAGARSRPAPRRRGRAKGGPARAPRGRSPSKSTKVASCADAADDHRGRQPALGRVGHAASGESPAASAAIQFQEGQRVAKGAPLVRLDPAVNEAEVAAGARQPHARQEQVRPRGRPRQEQLHLGPGQGRSREQPASVAEAAVPLARGEARQDGHPRAVLGDHRPALRVDRRLRQGRRRHGQPRVDRSAQGRLPRARDLHAPGAGRAVAARSRSTRMPGSKFEGKVFAVNPLVDAAGRAVVIRAQVRNQDTVAAPRHVRARAGSSRATSRTRWSCPSRRIVPQGDEQFVFKVVDGKARAGEGRDRPAPRRQGRGARRASRAGDVIVTAGPAQAARRRAGHGGGAGRERHRAAAGCRCPAAERPHDGVTAAPCRITPADAAMREARAARGAALRRSSSEAPCRCPRSASSGRSSRRCCRSSSCWSGSSRTRACRCANTRASTSRSSASRPPIAARRPRSSSRRSPRPLEDSLAGIEGVEIMTSQSRSETSRINVRFTLKRDPDSAAADVRDKVSRVRGKLPRHDRRADHRQGRGRLAAGHLHRGRGRAADAARGIRLRQPLHPAAAVGAARRGRRAHLRRAPGVDAHQHRPHAPRRLQAHGAGRRGRASAGRTPRSRRAASSRTSREFTVVAETDLQHAGAVQQHHRRATSAAIRCASATSAPPRSARVDERTVSRFNGKPSLNIGVIKQAVANPLELSNGRARGSRQDQRRRCRRA